MRLSYFPLRLGSTINPVRQQRRTFASQVKFDKEADVVVVGSGAAGLTTAIVAANQGLKVLVI